MKVLDYGYTNILETTHGRIGTKGVTNKKVFTVKKDAQEYILKTTQEKFKKGYVHEVKKNKTFKN